MEPDKKTCRTGNGGGHGADDPVTGEIEVFKLGEGGKHTEIQIPRVPRIWVATLLRQMEPRHPPGCITAIDQWPATAVAGALGPRREQLRVGAVPVVLQRRLQLQ